MIDERAATALLYRARALEMMGHAERAASPHLKLYYVEMANSWHVLAEQVERNSHVGGTQDAQEGPHSNVGLLGSPLKPVGDTVWDSG